MTSALACVKPINAGVRVYVVRCAGLRADVRMDESDGQATAVCEESREALLSPLLPPQWICARRVLGASLDGGVIPTVQDGHLAFLHRSGHDRTASREINHRSKFRIYAASSYANGGLTDRLPR